MRTSRTGRTAMAALAIVVAGLSGATALLNGRGPKDQNDDLKKAIDSGRARNVILFIGDGMGDSEITAARNYQVGVNGGCRWTRCR